jgi:hypothetical protein
MTCRFNDKDPEYRFGIEGAWLLAPTRHGAHNWEGGTALNFVEGNSLRHWEFTFFGIAIQNRKVRD